MTISETFRRALAALVVLFTLTATLAAPNALAQEGGQDASQEAGQDSATPPEAQALIDILENEEARAALIERLKGAAAETQEVVVEEQPVSLGRRIAEFTSGAADSAATAFSATVEAVMTAPEAFNSLTAEQIDLLVEALKALALVIVVTTAIFIVLRLWARRLYRAMGETTQDAGLARTLATILATTVIDALVVIVAWGAGYLAALLVSGDIGVRQSLYLNAFLIVGMVKVAIRAVMAPSTSDLRLIAVPDGAARFMSTGFGLIASTLGYGQLLIVPIVNRQASLEAGRGISTLLALVTLVIAAWMVIAGRRGVANWLLGDAPETKPGVMRFAARNWHFPVLLYLFGLFLIVAARPDGLILPLLVNSAQVVGVIVAGIVLSGVITRSIARGVSVPDQVSARLPALERRLNAFVPKALIAIRALIVLAVLAFALNAIDAIDLGGWFEGEFGARATAALVSIAGILLFGFAAWLALVSWVDFRLNPDYGSAPTSREETLLSLLKNAATVMLLVITLMFVLSELGVDIAPLIASAGVLGLAIGFGAQKMVQDVITGVFIQLENAMNVGDVVTLGGTTGVVEKLTIRSVGLRDVDGVYHLVPFSSVDMVSNYVKGYGNFVCDMGIAYREDIDEAKEAMHEAFEKLRENEDYGPNILGDLQWFGVQALGDSAVVLRARIKCAPGQQWGIGRAYNEICKKVFDERDIEIPFPHQTIYFGVDKKGEAPPARILSAGGEAPQPPEPAAPKRDKAPKNENAIPASDDIDDGDDDGGDNGSRS